MSRKKLLQGTWLTVALLMSLTAFTMYFVAQMRVAFLLYSYSALVVSQAIALGLFLVGSEKLKALPLRLIYRLCCVASVAVIPAFAFILTSLLSQYHADVDEAVYVSPASYEQIKPGEATTVYRTDSLYVFFPQYSQVSLVCGERPSQSDGSITWCSGAAFQHKVELTFDDRNIEGCHASDGVYSDSEYSHEGMAAFVFYDGAFRFVFDDPETSIRQAAEHGGSGFMQYALIRDGRIVNALTNARVRSYRALAELNGNLCVIDSINMIRLDDFLAELQGLGVTNAVYMDMGSGWNYSWYRTAAGKAVTLFGLKVPWSHNWIVFRR